MLILQIDRTTLEQKRANLAQQHSLNLVGDQGTVSNGPVSVEFEYHEPELVLNVTNAPPFMTGIVEQQIQNWFTT